MSRFTVTVLGGRRAFVVDNVEGVAVELEAVVLPDPSSEILASYHSDLNALNAPSVRIFKGDPSDTRQDRTPAPPCVEGAMAAKQIGETNGNSKLDAKRVQQIRDNVRLGFSQRAVAAHFGLSQATVSDICAGRMWGHIPDEPASPLRRVSFELVDPVMRSNRGRFGGPRGVVDLYPEQTDDEAESPPPPRAA